MAITPSTRHPDRLPPPARLRDLLRALAMLDAILQPDWEYRYFSFDPAWAPGQELGSMRNGEGDWFFAWFPAPGACAIRGFDHESPMTPFQRPGETPWPGLYDGLPASLGEVPAMGGFPPEEVTFCLWNTGSKWHRGNIDFPADEDDPDGSERLLALLDDRPESYLRLAEEVHERELPLAAVRSIYRGEPLTNETILAIDPDADTTAVARAAQEIGYPMTTSKKTTAKKPPSAAKQEEAAAAPLEPASPPQPAPPKAAATKGHADFLVEVRGPTVRMLVNGKAAAEYTGDGFTLYNEIFDLVKARIKAAKKAG
jgi:hypothetical protein